MDAVDREVEEGEGVGSEEDGGGVVGEGSRGGDGRIFWMTIWNGGPKTRAQNRQGSRSNCRLSLHRANQQKADIAGVRYSGEFKRSWATG